MSKAPPTQSLDKASAIALRAEEASTQVLSVLPFSLRSEVMSVTFLENTSESQRSYTFKTYRCSAREFLPLWQWQWQCTQSFTQRSRPIPHCRLSASDLTAAPTKPDWRSPGKYKQCVTSWYIVYSFSFCSPNYNCQIIGSEIIKNYFAVFDHTIWKPHICSTG